MTSPPLTIVLDEKRQRFASWLQKLQHAVGGVPLLLAGVHHWRSPVGSGGVLASKRRRIQFDDAWVRVRLSRFRGFTVAWTDVREIRITTASIVIDAASGSHTISLRRYRNAMEIRSAFEEWSVVHA